jgi:hypothetical protein
MANKLQRRIDRLIREKAELLEDNRELKEALELSEQLKDKYRAALIRARGAK